MNERQKRLLETMKSLNKDFKEETVFFGDEIENKEIINLPSPTRAPRF